MRGALAIFLWSRLGIWLAALAAYGLFEPNRPAGRGGWDDERLHDVGWAVDVWARWDSGWFLRIAEHGYGSDAAAPAFYPLYPALVAALGRLFLGHYVLAGVVISLVAAAAAFVLLERLGRLKLGDHGGERAVLYLALFPTALFLQAVYSESLFVALAVAAFLLAEHNRFGWAAAAAGLAVLTRVVGVALLPALAVLAWRSPDRRRALASLLLAPALFTAFPLLLRAQVGAPFAFLDAQRESWQREPSALGPLGGSAEGVEAAWAGVRQLLDGSRVYWPAVNPADKAPFHAAFMNLQQLAFLVVFTALAVVAWRRLGAPYGLFAALALALPLSAPAHGFPLLSMPRFGLAVFPLFLAAAAVTEGRPRLHAAVLGTSAALLGVAVAQWATWQWVS